MNDTNSSPSNLRLGIVSDTHGLVRPALFGLFDGVHAILHAGDVGDEDVLLDLQAIAPTHAVRGNVDGTPYPERLVLSFAGWRFGVAHGHLFPARDRIQVLLETFADADFVLYGHTHQAHFEQIGTTTVINPGSAGPRRFAQPVTAGVLGLQPDGWVWTLHDLETNAVVTRHTT